MTWRVTGSTAARVVHGPTGAAAPATLAISGQSNGGLAHADFDVAPGQRAGFRVEIDQTGTGCRIKHLKDGMVLRGESDAFTDLTGIPAGAYFWLGAHGGISAPDDVCSVGPATLYAGAIDMPRSVYLDAAAPDAFGTGTQDDPLLEPSQVSRFVARDRYRRQFKVRLKGGTFPTGIQIADSSFIDELAIEAPQGEKCILEPADLLAGGGLWTAIPGEAPLWQLPAVFSGATSYGLGNASVIEVPGAAFPNLTQTTGFGASTHSYPWVIYTRYPNNTALATLKAMPASYSVHTAGPYAGKLVLHARGGADPNDLAFKRPLENAALAVLCSDPNDWNFTRVVVDGIEGRFAYSDIFQFQRCRVEHGPLVARASSVGHGFEYDECTGRAWGALSEGTAGDGANMGGSFGNLPLDLEPEMSLIGFRGRGSPLLATSFGDYVSNHENQRVKIFDADGKAYAKDGLSAGGEFSVFGGRIRGCGGSGIMNYGVAGRTKNGTVQGLRITDCQYGLSSVQDKLAGAGRIDATDMVYENIGSRTINATEIVGASATIALHGRQAYRGALPANGHFGGGATIEHVVDTPLPAFP
ncbi:hypothetical protein [Sphingopyxis granuli]|uniref:hypothetical protein n=1 Tax=Sphingopyxis granuli TaxID=267128 RepID=UPI001BB00DC6|nr:hypothetical protein [Sphingopyxis granuli]QUM73351.1 hypothetical protein ICN83_05545 [Sphingopyxis granuli]